MLTADWLGVEYLRGEVQEIPVFAHLGHPRGDFFEETLRWARDQSLWGPLSVLGQMEDSSNEWTWAREDMASQGHKERENGDATSEDWA